jgi:hypothetical protein
MRVSFILARIAARMGSAVRRQRFFWLGACAAVAILSLYQFTYAGPSHIEGDCADTTMAAIAKVDDDASRAAYECLDVSMRHASEETFVADMHEPDMPHGIVTRIGDKQTPDGGRVVFYAVETRGDVIGYMIYLNNQNKVVRVE